LRVDTGRGALVDQRFRVLEEGGDGLRVHRGLVLPGEELLSGLAGPGTELGRALAEDVQPGHALAGAPFADRRGGLAQLLPGPGGVVRKLLAGRLEQVEVHADGEDP